MTGAATDLASWMCPRGTRCPAGVPLAWYHGERIHLMRVRSGADIHNDRDLTGLLRESPVWRERENLLGSVKGVGQQTILSLCASLPELGRLNRRQLAALVGVARFNLRFRRTSWQTPLLGRTGGCTRRPLYGHPQRCVPQPRHTRLLSATGGSW